MSDFTEKELVIAAETIQLVLRGYDPSIKTKFTHLILKENAILNSSTFIKSLKVASSLLEEHIANAGIKTVTMLDNRKPSNVKEKEIIFHNYLPSKFICSEKCMSKVEFSTATVPLTSFLNKINETHKRISDLYPILTYETLAGILMKEGFFIITEANKCIPSPFGESVGIICNEYTLTDGGASGFCISLTPKGQSFISDFIKLHFK